MSDPKDFDWKGVVDDAQKLEQLRLQREQTELLKNIASNSGSQNGMSPLEIKLGIRRSDNPEEFTRRLKEWQKEGRKKTMKFVVYPLIGLALLLLLALVIVSP